MFNHKFSAIDGNHLQKQVRVWRDEAQSSTWRGPKEGAGLRSSPKKTLSPGQWLGLHSEDKGYSFNWK